ncbi:MAG: TetR/AcrR family transcriptional regulator [Nocardioides sp.]
MVNPQSAGVNALNEQRSTTSKRTYQKVKRAEDECRTRERIVDAAEYLHGTLGPANTTVSAVAGQAGVTRATVYRHFASEEALFLACSRQWLSRQRLPEPGSWGSIGDPTQRLRTGLMDIYDFYRSGGQMLERTHRDVDVVPSVVVAARRARERLWLDTLLAPQASRRKAVRAAVAHATAFPTWQSLCGAQGLTHRSAVELMVGMVEHIPR